jgi:hypothetical protein
MGGGGPHFHTKRDKATGRFVADLQRPRGIRRGPQWAYDKLSLHENFEFPEPPRDDSAAAVVDYVLESAARLISPPKVEHEDEHFRCDDIAQALRKQLRDEIRNRLGLDAGGS